MEIFQNSSRICRHNLVKSFPLHRVEKYKEHAVGRETRILSLHSWSAVFFSISRCNVIRVHNPFFSSLPASFVNIRVTPFLTPSLFSLIFLFAHFFGLDVLFLVLYGFSSPLLFFWKKNMNIMYAYYLCAGVWVKYVYRKRVSTSTWCMYLCMSLLLWN